MKMQEGFLWGGATAANQCEGSASAGPFALSSLSERQPLAKLVE